MLKGLSINKEPCTLNPTSTRNSLGKAAFLSFPSSKAQTGVWILINHASSPWRSQASIAYSVLLLLKWGIVTVGYKGKNAQKNYEPENINLDPFLKPELSLQMEGI